MDLPVYYTIMWDPFRNGQFQFYDRTFHTVPDVLLKRVENEFNRDLFSNVFVVKVSFTNLDYD